MCSQFHLAQVNYNMLLVIILNFLKLSKDALVDLALNGLNLIAYNKTLPIL